jgi:hypothetical protein
MEKPNPIRLPYEMEKEAEMERLRKLQEQIENHRKNGTLVSSIIQFLKDFEAKVKEFNQYLLLFTPYPTISKPVKDSIRNRLRIVNEFYCTYSGSNPHNIVTECLEKNNTEAEELNIIYKRLGDLLTRLNNHILCISNKQVIFIPERKHKKEYNWDDYDST